MRFCILVPITVHVKSTVMVQIVKAAKQVSLTDKVYFVFSFFGYAIIDNFIKPACTIDFSWPKITILLAQIQFHVGYPILKLFENTGDKIYEGPKDLESLEFFVHHRKIEEKVSNILRLVIRKCMKFKVNSWNR